MKNLCNVSLILIFCLICFSCGDRKSSPGEKGEIIVGMSQEPDSLDPLFGQMSASSQVLGACFKDFVERDHTWRLYAKVAKEMPSFENGLWKLLPGGKMETTWHIKPEARWEDGKPVTAYDAIFAHQVIMDDRVPVVSRDVDRRIEKMTAPDSLTLVVTWKEHFAYADLGHTILPKHLLEPVYKKDPANYYQSFYNSDPMGNGPYNVGKWIPGSQIVTNENPFYSFEKPKLQKVIFKFIPDTNTLMANVISGSIDAVTPAPGLTFDQGRELAKGKRKNIEVIFTPGIVWEHIDFNLDDPWLKDKRVRQALLYAIDRDKLSEVLFEKIQPVADSWLPSRHYGYNPNVKKYPYDPAKAKQLFAEAGWKPGPDGILRNAKGERMHLLLMSTAGDNTREQVEQILQSQWKNVGVEIEIKNEPGKVLFGNTIKYRKFPHMVMYAWTMSPIADGESLWTIDNIPSKNNNWQGQNNAGWRNEEANKIDHQVPTELDSKKRAELLRKEQEIWTEELPSIPLFFRSDVSVIKKGLREWLPTGTSTPITWNSQVWYFARAL